MAEPQKKPVQSDPWEEEAKSFKPSPQGAPAATEGGNDDWKVWQQGGETGTTGGEPGLTDYQPPSKGPAANFTEGVKEFVRPANNMFSAALRPFTQIPRAMTQPPEEPSIGDTLGRAVVGAAYDPIKGMVKGAMNAYREGGLDKALTETAGPLATGAVAGELGGNLVSKIPTRAKAGAIFNDLNTKLANQPVQLTESSPRLQRVAEIGERGGTLPSSVNKFLVRSQSPIDMTYPEARDYQSNLSSLSREDQGAMTGPMRGGVKQLNKAYFTDIKNAAGPYGEDYANAMKINRQANQIRKVAGKVGKAAAIGGAGAIGAGGAYRLAKDLIQ